MFGIHTDNECSVTCMVKEIKEILIGLVYQEVHLDLDDVGETFMHPAICRVRKGKLFT